MEAAKFCRRFIADNGHPDRVRLEGLRWDFIDPSGRSAVRGWVWDKVYWEYHDGRNIRSIEYPSYGEFRDLPEALRLGDDAGAKSFGNPDVLPSG
jgi:hypothetical protein